MNFALKKLRIASKSDGRVLLRVEFLVADASSALRTREMPMVR
jgi:hypothetical protein